MRRAVFSCPRNPKRLGSVSRRLVNPAFRSILELFRKRRCPAKLLRFNHGQIGDAFALLGDEIATQSSLVTDPLRQYASLLAQSGKSALDRRGLSRCASNEDQYCI